MKTCHTASRLMALLLFLMGTAACGHNRPRQPPAPPERIGCDNPPVVEPVTWLPVTFDYAEDETGVVWITLTAQGYENMATNLQAAMRLIRQLEARDAYRRDCIEDWRSADPAGVPDPDS